MTHTTEQAGIMLHLGRLEAERLGHHYLGPEHLLLGLLRDARTRSAPACIRRTDDCAACWACPTMAPTRSSCWSRRED